MSDQSLRELEARVLAQPDDERALAQLGMERLRAGLGWHGEALPDRLWARTERNVYALGWEGRLKAAAEVPRMEFVYVPDGEVQCSRCGGVPHVAECAGCDRGRRKIPPFYVGRYPVTCGEWKAFLKATDYHPDSTGRRFLFSLLDANEHHPATHVKHEDALAFCEWAGLRLPTADEWRWAALGAPIPCANCGGGRHGALGGCVECNRTGKRLRRFPWSAPEDTWRENGPTSGRCVFSGGTAPVVVRRHECGNTIHECAVTDPVMQCERHDFDSSEWLLVPARPAGASWCGAMDMAGNVWEWTADGEQAGGSFSTGPTELCLVVGGRAGTSAHLHRGAASDDVGFRVVLSAAPAGASS